MIALPPGLIFEIADDAGIVLKGKGAKRQCRCPIHDDKSASAFVSEDNVFYCSVCTPSGGWPAKALCEKLGSDWKRYVRDLPRDPVVRRQPTVEPEVTFTPADALALWKTARARARDDECIDQDRPAYDYLESRGLMEAYELGVFGILATGMTLPPDVATWPQRGYRIVAALYDTTGKLTNVQARTIRFDRIRTLVPTGSKLAGTLFAEERALMILRGQPVAADTIIYGEGLTDFLALSITALMPVFAAPGTGNAVGGVDQWARGRRVLLALDNDNAGNAALVDTRDALYRHGATNVRRIVWPTGCKDACDVIAKRGTTGLSQLIRRFA